MELLNFDVHGLLGITPISTVSDTAIWRTAVSPQVKALLGEIDVERAESGVTETVAGKFAGDEVSNQNDHRLYGGTEGFVRFPFIASYYPTKNGLFVIKRDGMKIEAFGWFGAPPNLQTQGSAQTRMELVFQFGLRDRRFDGTRRANDSPLVHYPYDDPRYNDQLVWQGRRIAMPSLETSLYSFFPGSKIGATCGDAELEQFVASPYRFVDRPELFLRLFNRIWQSDRFPGQIGAPFPDVGKLTHEAFDAIARQAGYEILETCPSHLHVLRWNQKNGYHIVDPVMAATVSELEAGLKRIKSAGVTLTRQQEAWVCVLQSLPAEHIPPHLYLGGAKWPQDNVGPQNLWLVKPLTDRARQELGL